MNTRLTPARRAARLPALRASTHAVRLVLAGLACVGLASPLHAAEAAPDGRVSATDLDAVEVVAQRASDYRPDASATSAGLVLSARETPQSITVVTRQRIEDEGLETVTDVVANTTGVSVNQYETHRAGFTARGFDITHLQVDGVPTTWEAAWSSGEVQTSLAAYDRVEVVRGATGLMTGAGDPSAAINLIRKRADSRELTGNVELGVGSWDRQRMYGDVAAPLNASGSVRVRASGEFAQGGSWLRHADDQSSTLFATLEADLTPSTRLTLGVSEQETRSNGPMWGGLPYRYADSGRVIPWDRSDTTAAKWTRWDTAYTNAYARLEHRFANGWRVRADASRGKRDADSFLLYLSGPLVEDGTGLTAFPGAYITATRQDDVGLHLDGPFTLGGREHEFAAGLLYSDNDFIADSRDAPWPYPEVGDFDDWDGNYPEPAWGAPYRYENGHTRQDALYAVARWSLGAPVSLVTGARVTDYTRTGEGLWTAPHQVDVDHEVTPYAGVVWDFSPAWSAYASYTDIFRPQDARDLEGDLLDPVIGKSAEVGLKAELAGGRLYASAALFRIEQDNLAQEAGVVDRGNGPEVYYRAAEGATSDGFEIDLAGEILPGWNASAGYSQFEAEDANGDAFNTIYPRKLLRVFTTWRLPGAWRALTLGGGASWESRTYTIDPALPGGSDGRIEQAAFALVNVMARYALSDNVALQLNVDNLLDESHFGMFSAYNALTFGAPRSVNATLRYRF
ncbi:TonB-dependent siderophore receptor [Marilutibacter aestuarii]|uniref:TonB-dependent siderophore receptor n=1 Tax=Marilutibacter aestuarii TaxID=1706195 RepID=A0A508A0B0_9GAMM|nr:TonB-dependent siderophore receptor [Lysobacter aestuarii]TQD40355.1 TonB-dependent siderophore receptor [Lysobacter aestuarii]